MSTWRRLSDFLSTCLNLPRRMLSSNESRSAELPSGLEQESETSVPNLATHLAWTIAELSKDLERFQRITDWPFEEIHIWLNDVCNKLAEHLAFMRRQGVAPLLKNYPWRETSVVLPLLQGVHDQRTYIRNAFAELEARYDEEIPRNRQIVGCLAAVLLVHTSLSNACRILVDALEILDGLKRRKSAGQNPPEVQFSRLHASNWVTMKDEYSMCCDGASLIIARIRWIDKSALRKDFGEALQRLQRWGRVLFPVQGPGLDELFDLDNQTTKGTRELLHRVFGLIIICQGECVNSKDFSWNVH